MNAINIDENNKLIINPMKIDSNKYKVGEAETQAPDTQDFNYVEPVTFGTGCFGNPVAFNRLQELLHQRNAMNEEPVIEENSQETANVLETNYAQSEVESGVEPAFC